MRLPDSGGLILPPAKELKYSHSEAADGAFPDEATSCIYSRTALPHKLLAVRSKHATKAVSASRSLTEEPVSAT